MYEQAGNDAIVIAGWLNPPASVCSGDGDDLIVGGDEENFFYGGDVNDILLDGNGNDTLDRLP